MTPTGWYVAWPGSLTSYTVVSAETKVLHPGAGMHEANKKERCASWAEPVGSSRAPFCAFSGSARGLVRPPSATDGRAGSTGINWMPSPVFR
ncbi:Uncharacterised protein [Mycobacteroides abscessus subsp. abscessus]|nr:Uncharacterised protein [Mycobacteroides abscessus subsp. abscessus]